jgi:hypothetical protein
MHAAGDRPAACRDTARYLVSPWDAGVAAPHSWCGHLPEFSAVGRGTYVARSR